MALVGHVVIIFAPQNNSVEHLYLEKLQRYYSMKINVQVKKKTCCVKRELRHEVKHADLKQVYISLPACMHFIIFFPLGVFLVGFSH